jgi:hypothetical protein
MAGVELHTRGLDRLIVGHVLSRAALAMAFNV